MLRQYYGGALSLCGRSNTNKSLVTLAVWLETRLNIRELQRYSIVWEGHVIKHQFRLQTLQNGACQGACQGSAEQNSTKHSNCISAIMS